MSNAPNRPEQLALEFLGRVWGPQHDSDAIEELMTEDYVITSGGNVIQGREAFKAWVEQFQSPAGFKNGELGSLLECYWR